MSKKDTPKEKRSPVSVEKTGRDWIKPDSTSGRVIDKRTRRPDTDPVGKPLRPGPIKIVESKEPGGKNS
jgi:hypothetical protein